MPVAEPPLTAQRRVVGYRFDGVVLDLHRGSLTVDGAAVAKTPLLLQLLQILCASAGRLLARQELFDALWPGGQSMSDAARASATLAEAWQMNPHVFLRPALLLVAFENELAPPGDAVVVAAEIADEPAFAGVAELLRGWQALAAG